jgi:hypothetical protein
MGYFRAIRIANESLRRSCRRQLRDSYSLALSAGSWPLVPGGRNRPLDRASTGYCLGCAHSHSLIAVEDAHSKRGTQHLVSVVNLVACVQRWAYQLLPVWDSIQLDDPPGHRLAFSF